ELGAPWPHTWAGIALPRASASAGVSRSASKRINRRNIETALVGDAQLVEGWPQPALGRLERDAAPRGIVLELVAADAGDAEILGVAVPEVEARHRRGR